MYFDTKYSMITKPKLAEAIQQSNNLTKVDSDVQIMFLC